jgi:HK97 family phage prohead protease
MADDSGIPGHLPHQLASWWEHGAGAAKIGWGTPGSFVRCVRLAVAEAHMDPERAKGFCAERYHAATGTWPGQHSGKHAGRADMTVTQRAEMTSASINDLPDSEFAYIEPGGTKDASGKTVPRSKRHFPVHDKAHVQNALSRAPQSPFGDKAMPKIKARAKKFGVDVSSDSSSGSSRAEYMRLYALEDIHILRSADGGDGRTVEAYAAVFGEPAEIQDHEGHYVEVIDPAAFNRAIDHASRARGGFPGSVKVLWNHGRDLAGSPSDRFSMPIGIPVDIRAEARGLLTRTRYSETPLADEVLENIRAGSITSQSFTGRIMRSDPQLRRGERYRPDSAGNLRTVRRTELGLREYGPVLWPAYSGAEIVGVRMSTPGAYALDPDDSDEALPLDEEPAAGDPLTRASGEEHSARYHQHALYVLRSKEARERAGLVF